MSTGVVWFRKCLRLDDNPSLLQACNNDALDSILPIFILDPVLYGEKFEKYSRNRLQFLLESLSDLDKSLGEFSGHSLHIFWGNPVDAFTSLLSTLGQDLTLFTSDYCSEPHGRSTTSDILSISEKLDHLSCYFIPAAHTILDLEKTIAQDGFKPPKSMKEIEKLFLAAFTKDEGGFFQVPDPVPQPTSVKPPPPHFDLQSSCSRFKGELHSTSSLQERLRELGFFEPTEKLYFKGGESEALARLKAKVSAQHKFVNSFRKPKTISTNLDSNPEEPSTTGLSPYLATGSLSVRRLWKEVEHANREGPHSSPPESLHGQLLFREMFYLLSLCVPNWDNDSGNPMCKKINWGADDETKLTAWSEGKTGFPLIDAMMRQLDATGWMHHLGRHAVSCFLTRGQLWQHWKKGRDVFEQKLLDSDWALNNANWLWLSGVAPFSMPYFRLYNPCPDAKSSLNVDTISANFIRYWVPELKDFPIKYIYEPHLAPVTLQEQSGCIIGKDYPYPIVDRKASAKENLAKFKASLN